MKIGSPRNAGRIALAAFLFAAGGIHRHAAAGDEAAQAAQLRNAAADPKTVSDKLFVLWEYAGAVRERALAKVVLEHTQDAEIRALAALVRDGHEAGMNAMVPIASDLGIALPDNPTEIERAGISAVRAMPAAEIDRFFLLRQRAMHAWDITSFDAFGATANNAKLRRYIEATRKPLREHAQLVGRLSIARGIPGDIAVFEAKADRPK